MILSRLIVDPYFGAGFAVASDVYRTHLFVSTACGTSAKERPLYRVEPAGRPVILVQSQSKPDWPKALQAFDIQAEFESKEFSLDSVKRGQQIAYRLLANPVKTIKDERGRTDSRGRPKRVRVPLVSDQMQRQWLERKANKLGVDWRSISVSGRRLCAGHKPKSDGQRSYQIRIDGVVYEGVLIVRDPELFRRG